MKDIVAKEARTFQMDGVHELNSRNMHTRRTKFGWINPTWTNQTHLTEGNRISDYKNQDPPGYKNQKFSFLSPKR